MTARRSVSWLAMSISCCLMVSGKLKQNKKAGVAEHRVVFDNAGLLANEPPDQPGCSLSSHPTSLIGLFKRSRLQIPTDSLVHHIVPRRAAIASQLSGK